jgi:D-3-phosphoglycerate dehydrogenase
MAPKPRVLVAEALASVGLDHLNAHLEVIGGTGADRARFLELLGDVDGVVIRSKTKLDREAIESAPRLKAIGRAGVGYDNVDVEAANERGILVMNVPEGNTIAAAEHSVAILLALLRNIPRADAAMKAGRWDRGKFMGTQLAGKTVGVIGLGKIGYRVAKRLQAFETTLLVHDPYAPAERLEELGGKPVGLDELLAESDVVTLHAPNTEATRNLINKTSLAKMKSSAVLVNCARGDLVDSAAVLSALESGNLAGAALDVYSTEPLPDDDVLRSCDHPGLLLTPHLGASTREAQDAVGEAIAEQMVAALLAGEYPNAVNLPPVTPEELEAMRPFLNLATRLGHLFAVVSPELLGEVMVTLEGGEGRANEEYLKRAVQRGMLASIVDQPVTYVNAPLLAEKQGLSITLLTKERPRTFTHRLTIAAGPRRISGIRSPSNKPYMVSLDGFELDLPLEGSGVLIKHHDQPGVIGHVGTCLAEMGVNISRMDVGRKAEGSDARMAIAVDGRHGHEVVDALEALPDVQGAVYIEFEGGSPA